MVIDNIRITASGFNPERDELKEYVEFVKNKVPNVAYINVVMCEDGFVDLNYTVRNVPFERIRRITGE